MVLSTQKAKSSCMTPRKMYRVLGRLTLLRYSPGRYTPLRAGTYRAFGHITRMGYPHFSNKGKSSNESVMNNAELRLLGSRASLARCNLPSCLSVKLNQREAIN